MNRVSTWTPPEAEERGWTIERHILEGQRSTPGATGELTGVLQQITLCSKIIASRVNMAGLAGDLGLTGQTNVQGEEVQKLDDFANQTLIRTLSRGGHCWCRQGASDTRTRTGSLTTACGPQGGSLSPSARPWRRSLRAQREADRLSYSTS